MDAFVDYFRCPGHLAALAPPRELPAGAGYFRFRDAVGYGRQAAGPVVPCANGSMPDLWPAAACEGGRVRLPFDLAEVVTNLRYERYRQHAPGAIERLTASAAAHAVYYRLRPVLTVGVRKHLQRLRLTGWQRIAFPRWPLDVSVDALMRDTMALVLACTGRPVPFIWFWPEGAPACAMITHDVEGAAGAAFCDRLMDLDETFGVRSAFQVVPDAPWDPSRAATRQMVERLRARGFEVNVHDLSHDGHLFEDRERFVRFAAAINRRAQEFGSRGFRSGAMYRRQDWFAALEFAYDMSVPNAAHLEPQRGGCCTVMPYFIGDVLELPLTTAQDYSLFHVLGDYSTALWQQQVDGILAHNGLASFIAHPDYVREPRAQEVYTDLLRLLVGLREDRGVWLALPSEIDAWWRQRREMRLVADGDRWRIEGPGSERARLAWARLDDGRATCAVEAA